MGPAGDTWARLRRCERGYTLIELLVASSMALVVLGGGLLVFISVVRSEPRTSSKVSAIQEARFTAERIVRELRQGTSISTAEASELSLTTYVRASACGGAGSEAAPCIVTYACGEGECTRTAEAPGSGEPSVAAQVVSGLTSDQVFAYLPEAEAEEEATPEYVGVTLSFDTLEGNPVVISDGAALRRLGA